MRKFIVISDLHIVPEGQLSRGLDTTARLEATLADINANHPDAAALILAGDLVDNGDAAAYERLKGTLAAATLPITMTLGNHDDRATFQAAFPEAARDPAGFVQAEIPLGDARVVVIDTLRTGKVEGEYCAARHAWLGAVLAREPERNTVVVAHHTIAPQNVDMDRFLLEDGPALAETLKTGRVAAVISGHCHGATASVFEGVPMLTISGCHYEIDPDHGYYADPARKARHLWDGPIQYGVVYADAERFTLHYRNLPTPFAAAG